ncbi:MAG: polymerase, partial [Inhella sp.]
GVGWGEFNRAWTLTPFPDRPVAFFDHSHNLPLQLLVELGWPLGLAVMGLLLTALAQALRLAWRAQGDEAMVRRAALMLVVVVGLHSLLEYPLWYA